MASKQKFFVYSQIQVASTNDVNKDQSVDARVYQTSAQGSESNGRAARLRPSMQPSLLVSG